MLSPGHRTVSVPRACVSCLSRHFHRHLSVSRRSCGSNRGVDNGGDTAACSRYHTRYLLLLLARECEVARARFDCRWPSGRVLLTMTARRGLVYDPCMFAACPILTLTATA